MRRPLAIAVGAALVAAGLAVSAAGASRTAGPPPIPTPPKPGSKSGVFLAKYHLSGYGVYRRTTYWEYKAAPCQAGGKGGGDDGLVRNDTTIRWETAAPATVMVQRFPGAVPFMTYVYKPGAAAAGPGIIATVTVTSKLTNSVDNVECHLDGSEERHGVPYQNKCGVHTYTRGYYAGVQWPRVFPDTDDRVSVGVVPLETKQQQVGNDWHKCFGAHYQFDKNNSYTSVPLPFVHLPRKMRGKLTVIPRGHETVIDSTNTQNGQGGSVHQYDAYNETSYVTWIRVG
jgi:hypothetical protein